MKRTNKKGGAAIVAVLIVIMYGCQFSGTGGNRKIFTIQASKGGRRSC